MGERCGLIVMEECEKLVRLSLPPAKYFNWFTVVSLACSLNEIVQWILKIAIKVMQTKALTTLRKAELSAIIAKAPIFEQLHPHLAALQERPVLMPSPKQEEPPNPLGISGLAYEAHPTTKIAALGPDYPLLGGPIQSPTSLSQHLSSVAFSATSMSVDDLVRVYEQQLKSPLLPQAGDSVTRPREAGLKVRYVACTDQAMPWMKVKENPSEEVRFVQSTAVQTDEPPADTARFAGTRSAEQRALQEEVNALKSMMVHLLKNK